MSGSAFDAVAETYDREFTNKQPGRWFRDTVWGLAKSELDQAHRVLDIGCGTGEDAIFIAGLGKTVCAVDASAAMIRTAHAKAVQSGVHDRITFYREKLETLRLEGEKNFDGLISNFGPLNCVEDLSQAADVFEGKVRPGGTAILVVMGPWCPWEVGWYVLHGRFGQGFRRFRRGLEVPVGDGSDTVAVWYHRPGALIQAFQPGFDATRLVGLGSLLPPPYLSGLVDRLPRVFSRIAGLERRVSGRFPFNRLCDHYAVVLRRKS